MRRYDCGTVVAVIRLLLVCELQALGAKVTGIKRPKAGETVEVLVQYANQPAEYQHRRMTDHNGRNPGRIRTRAGGSGGIIDSGVNPSNINLNGYESGTSRIVYSQFGHGTHVAGIAAARSPAWPWMLTNYCDQQPVG
jgi:subtilisin family serine protease